MLNVNFYLKDNNFKPILHFDDDAFKELVFSNQGAPLPAQYRSDYRICQNLQHCGEIEKNVLCGQKIRGGAGILAGI